MKRLLCVLVSLALLFCAAPLGALAEGGVTQQNLDASQKETCQKQNYSKNNACQKTDHQPFPYIQDQFFYLFHISAPGYSKNGMQQNDRFPYPSAPASFRCRFLSHIYIFHGICSPASY